MNKEHYFDHDADIGIIGRGNSLEQSFEDAAKTMFALMGDLSSIQTRKTITVNFEESDAELALITWLNLLIGQAQAHHLLLCQFHIKRQGSVWQGKAAGEHWRPQLKRGIEVKGATFTMLSIKQVDDLWEVRCVVDV